ncbi:MAG: HD domain-containing protein [Clostridia bacterium]|nr:HD domain-containing protein [Clostridia bacterium]
MNKKNFDISTFFNNEDYLIFKNIANKISDNNGNLYLVGGSVRDIFLNKTPHDFDFCIVGLDENNFENLFPNAIKQGKSFPVYILNNCEFALARKEIKSGIRHSDFEVSTNKNISINDDLIRRDLTINSIAINFLTNEIIDPFNGISDIKNKILRHTSAAFIEDPLRVYRVARFASQLNFKVHNSTLELMKSMKKELINLSAERVFVEFRKALISNNPTNFFKTLRLADCLDIHFNEISDLIGVEQPILYHPEGDAYNHTLEVLERTSKITNNELIRFGALVHDFGKAVTPKSNWPHHYEHEKLGVPIVKQFCTKLKMPNLYLKAGCIACREHMLAGIYDRLKPGTKIDFFERVYKSNSLTLKGLEIIANADKNKIDSVKFADIAEKIMTTIKLDNLDLDRVINPTVSKTSKSSKTSKHSKQIEQIKQFLKDKRIKALLELEKGL